METRRAKNVNINLNMKQEIKGFLSPSIILEEKCSQEKLPREANMFSLKDFYSISLKYQQMAESPGSRYSKSYHFTDIIK